MSHDRSGRDGGGRGDNDAKAVPAPGKSTLVSQTRPSSGGPAAAVGRRTLTEGSPTGSPGGPPTKEDPRAIAARGTQGASTRIPYLEVIKRSFGRHNVEDVRVSVGGEAEEATRAIGANAYALGDRVAFRSAPDLRTAAHEAAHTVQQRAGVTGLTAGVGKAGDQYEQNANAVADAVVAGQSAEALLDKFTTGGSASASAVVQRDDDDEPTGVLAIEFLESDLYLDSHLRESMEFLQFAATGPFSKYVGVDPTFSDRMIAKIVGAPRSVVNELKRLVMPESLEVLIDRTRGREWDTDPTDGKLFQLPRGPTAWTYYKPVVMEICNALGRRYDESMRRIFPRVLGLYGEKQNQNKKQPDDAPLSAFYVNEKDVLVSHPMDVLVASALTGAQHTIPFDKAALELPNVAVHESNDLKIGRVVLAKPKDLWHWFQALPADATAEQVAAELFSKPEEAHRLIAMKPLWGFRANDVFDMKEGYRNQITGGPRRIGDFSRDPRMPADLQVATAGLDPALGGEGIDPIAELLASRGDAISMQQARAKHPEPDPKAATGSKTRVEDHDEADIYAELNSGIELLGPVGMQLPMFGLSAAPANKQAGMMMFRRDQATKMSMADREAQYGRAVDQRELLTQISLGLAEVAGKLVENGAAAAAPVVVGPVREVAQAYYDAIVALELPEAAKPRVLHAEELKKTLDITILEAKLHQGLPGIKNALHGTRVGNDDYDPTYAEGRTEFHLFELAESRRKASDSPDKADKVAAEKREKVDSLEFEIGIGDKLRGLDTMWSALDQMDDIWLSSPGHMVDASLRSTNRRLYEAFRDDVYLKFLAAQKEPDVAQRNTQKKAVQDAYVALVNGAEFQSHAKAVHDFLKYAAKEKKWTKIIVGIAIAFAAFGLGQFAFAAVIADGAGIFEAAVVGGLVTTASSATLEKIVLGHDPTLGGIITGLVSNVAIFGIVGKLAAGAKAAGIEADMLKATATELRAEGAAADAARAAKAADAASAGGNAAEAAKTAETASTAAKGAKYAKGLAVEMAIAEALGFVQGEVASMIDNGRPLTTAELREMFVQQLVGVVGMRVAGHMHEATIGEFKNSGIKAIDGDVKWLVAEQAEIAKLGESVSETAKKHPHGVPDRAAATELIDRWRAYLERERVVREKILAYAEKHPNKFKPESIEKMKNETGARGQADLARATAALSIEQTGPNTYRVDPKGLDIVMSQHKSAGNEIVSIHTDPYTGQRKVKIQPADGTPAFEITETLPPKSKRTQAKIPASEALPFEQWLDAESKKLPGDPGLAEVRDLYLRDPRAGMNLAAERNGYLPHEIPVPDPLVRPGEAAPKKPGEGGYVTSGHDTAIAIGGNVTPLANDTFLGHVHGLAELRASWKQKHHDEPSAIHYDPETNSVYFEGVMDVGGKPTKVRVQAELTPRIESFEQLGSGHNRVVGRPVPLGEGHQILRDLNTGNPAALERLGISGEKRMPNDPHTEFGLGETSDGNAVIIVGEPGAVDWAGLPGIKPRGHTHPDVPGNNIPGGGDKLSNILAQRDVPVLSRAFVFPSPADFIVMADMAVDAHTVHVPYVIDETGFVSKPTGPTDNRPRMEITIKGAKEIGTRASGERVYQATVEIVAGKTRETAEVWVVETGPNHAGDLHMVQPPDLVPTNAPKGKPGSKTNATTTPKGGKPDDPRTAAEAEKDPKQAKRYAKPKYRDNYPTFAEWWEAKGKKWHPNQHGKPGKPDDHQPTVDRLADKARNDFPDDIVHRGGSIVGMKTPKGREIRTVSREPDVWVEDRANRGVVKKIYEAARQNKDETFVKREREKKKQYDALGIPSEFEPVRPEPAATISEED